MRANKKKAFSMWRKINAHMNLFIIRESGLDRGKKGHDGSP